MGHLGGNVALITGTSSGIGEAVARAFAAEEAKIVMGARRLARVEALAMALQKDFGTECLYAPLDVTKPKDGESLVNAAIAKFGRIDFLINNAGLARGKRYVAQGDEREWNEMIDTNVKGLLTVTRLVLPHMLAKESGHIVNIGSVAGLGVYEGGSVYCATKWAVKAITQTLRLELNGTGVRVTEICPGLVETEFSLVRFHREENEAQAKKQSEDVYKGFQPLTAADIADAILWAVTRPPHVDIDEVVIRPTAQSGMGKVARQP